MDDANANEIRSNIYEAQRGQDKNCQKKGE
jgi:hypothetical protein